MTRRAPIPFDPDALGGGVLVHAAPKGETMLSEIVEAQDWHGDGNHAAAAVPAVAKGLSKPLSNHQKWKLSELAASVYSYLRSQGELAGENLKDYRQRIATQACSKRISQASHGDFMLIQAAFLHERGRIEEAKRALVKAAGTAHAIAMNALRKLCADTQTPPSHAHTMAKRFYKGAALTDLTADQVWSIFYTIRNNANAKAGVGSKANRHKNLRRKSA
ncbi:MAG: hypothetical protein ACYC67_10330 [Prosthecobacter sp.]